ncbi:hypothetical protein C8R45DRAFT_989791 [Mycena sanguinolenta]|nr:hypothetical protein C8R45DRAFT_989791 [Mycena sanguinolenta]
MDPLLPPELESEIFETAATRNPNSIPILLLVCRRVHAWIEPLLYRVLFISRSTAPFLPAVEAKSPTFLRNAVRHVYFSVTATDTIKRVLLECTGIISLFIDQDLDFDLLPILANVRAQNLRFWAPRSLNLLNSHPMFQSVTHLEVYQDSGDGSTWDEWSWLPTLPALTHLCLSEELSRDILQSALAECPRLVVAITAFWDADQNEIASEFAQAVTIADPRIVVMVAVNYKADWKTGVCDGADFWTRADAFVTSKRKGEIESTNLTLDFQRTA